MNLSQLRSESELAAGRRMDGTIARVNEPTAGAAAQAPRDGRTTAGGSRLRGTARAWVRACGTRNVLAAAGWVMLSVAAFHLAYAWPAGALLTVVYLFGLAQLARLGTWRRRYYAGLAVGLALAVGQLGFFWRIFSGGAVALWYIVALWTGLFVALAGVGLRRFGERGWLLAPFLWVGLEWFRSEGYYLRFSWLSPGFAFAGAPSHAPLSWAGAYGTGFLLAAVASAGAWLWPKSKGRALVALAAGTGAIALLGLVGSGERSAPLKTVHVAGVQLECPSEPMVVLQLNRLLRACPETELVVLSEYTFTGPVPAKIREWCRRHGRYLVVGGTEPAPGDKFYNTAFVIGPDGDIVFRQVKSVPIQFFKDGLPAVEQTLWASPWGKIGLCICYDLSYRRVTDRLAELGAQALIVPTMDVADWGTHQHELHARVAPVRAAEYGLPIFRLASSGISQCVDAAGRVLASAPYPGDGALLSGVLEFRPPKGPPLDRWLGPASALLAGLAGLYAFWCRNPRTHAIGAGNDGTSAHPAQEAQ